MAIQNLKCPHCGSLMDRVKDPDFTYERCSQCNGIFLDKGELDALATGMGGDIEYCSREGAAELTPKYPPRTCPKCPGQTMIKEDLLIYSDVIFDYCEHCQGWFLDRGELRSMNAFLQQLRKSRGGTKEARYYQRGYLVTVTEVAVTSFSAYSGAGAATAIWHRIDVYYRNPLGIGLRITPETWGAKIWQLFGGQDIEIGDTEFDRAFLIKADSPERTAKLLSDRVRQMLLGFAGSSFVRFGYKRTYEFLDDRTVFSYSDWGRKRYTPDEGEKEKLIDALVGITAAFSESAEKR